MIKHYFCASCDYNFSQVITGSENHPRCPRCGSSKPIRKHLRVKNSGHGIKIEGDK